MRDVMGLMKQVQSAQAKLQEMQAELETIEVEGQAGGGLVKVRLTAKGEIKGLSIDPSLAKPEEIEILEDLIAAAHAEARKKVEGVMAEKVKAATGGLALPPGLKLF
jgi:DNA-binding YbaB/EbfC family protein